jgi:hypothetical protein
MSNQLIWKVVMVLSETVRLMREVSGVIDVNGE